MLAIERLFHKNRGAHPAITMAADRTLAFHYFEEPPFMSNFKRICILLAASVLALGSHLAQAQGTLKVLNWSEHIGPEVISKFEKATGIKVI